MTTNAHNNDHHTNHGRRGFLKAGLAAGAMTLATGSGLLSYDMLSQSSRTKAAPLAGKKRMVIINLLGGNDGLNMVIPNNTSNYMTRRPSIGIDSSASLSLNSGPGSTTAYRLHPQLTYLQTLFSQGDLAIINKVGYPQANLSHFSSEDIWSYGVRGNFGSTGVNISGWIQRYIDTYLSGLNIPAAAIAVGKRPDFAGGNINALVVQSLTAFALQTDGGSMADNHAYRMQIIQQVLDAGETAGQWVGPLESAEKSIDQALVLSQLVQNARTAFLADSNMSTYVNVNISNYLRDVATLIHGGFDTELFYTGFGGFDTHAAQEGNLIGQNLLMSRLNAALTSFITDLKFMNCWNDTVIVVISEFGRRCFENGSQGTDHGHGNCVLVMGGAVSAGVYGDDITDADLNLNYLGYETDFRTIYKMIIENHLGRSVAPNIFPEALVKTASPGNFI